MFVIAYRKIFYILSTLLILASIGFIIFFGLNLGIDFKGGSITEIHYSDVRPDISVLQDQLKSINIESQIRPTDSTGYIIRMRNLTEPERQIVSQSLINQSSGEATISRFDSIGPLMGQEAKSKAVVSIIAVILAIILFIAFAFRHVSKPVSSWKYGFIAIIALAHDVIIPTGAFALFGYLWGFEIDTLFITALLVILGFSVHDTIVVFDRVRENLRVHPKMKFDELVGMSIEQTFVRSITTSLTTILALVCLYIFGPDATRQFTLAMLIGMIAGTYSSIFVGSPLLVTLQKFQEKIK
jgi:preprotein translocase subunit SecF